MLGLITVTVWLAALAVAQGPLRYETRRIEKNSPGCVVSFEYPEIISAASSEFCCEGPIGQRPILVFGHWMHTQKRFSIIASTMNSKIVLGTSARPSRS